jgi:acyl carrier protein
MSVQPDRSAGPTGEHVRDWLVQCVAGYVMRNPEQIATNVELSYYGLDSVYALSLCGEIEDQFHIPVEPTAIWDHPTIDALAGHLSERIAANCR